MVWILALDASLAACSVALLAEGEIRGAQRLATERGHAAALPRMLAEVLEHAGIRTADLDAVAAVVGPGGFTGLRAALALAEGVALAAKLPLLGVTTGEALASAIPAPIREQRAVWTAVDSRRGHILLERFAPGAWVPDADPAAVAEAALPMPDRPLALAGDAAPGLAAFLTARGVDVLLTDSRLPDAAAAARVAALRLAGRLPPRAARPLYAEPPAVRLPPGAAAGAEGDAV